MDEPSSEQQFHISDIHNYTFILCEKSDANGSYGRQAIRQNNSKFENSLQFTSLAFSWSLTKVQCYYSIEWVFLGRVYLSYGVFWRHLKFGHHDFCVDPYSLLLSITVLNDTHVSSQTVYY